MGGGMVKKLDGSQMRNTCLMSLIIVEKMAKSWLNQSVSTFQFNLYRTKQKNQRFSRLKISEKTSNPFSKFIQNMRI